MLFLFFAISCKNKETSIKKLADAEAELTEALIDSTKHNIINEKALIINSKDMAVAIAEPILFNTYGKQNIIKQKPYEIFFVKNYWIISGTLPKGHIGGTFLIIINALTAKVIKITHGK